MYTERYSCMPRYSRICACTLYMHTHFIVGAGLVLFFFASNTDLKYPRIYTRKSIRVYIHVHSTYTHTLKSVLALSFSFLPCICTWILVYKGISFYIEKYPRIHSTYTHTLKSVLDCFSPFLPETPTWSIHVYIHVNVSAYIYMYTQHTHTP